VKFAINLGHKTIAKAVAAKPEDVYAVGEEHTFGRLRVTVHAIKVKGRLLRRGSAPASEVTRVFARPTRPDRKEHRPEKAVRDRAREDAARAGREAGRGRGGAPGAPRAGAGPQRGARFGARRAREERERAARQRGYGPADDEEEEL